MRRSILGSIGVLALSVVLVVPLSSWPAGADGGFTDVPGDHPFVTEISWAVDRGITSGFPNGEFRPGQAVSRQAAAAFLYRLAREPAVTGAAGFSEVPSGHPFHDEIAWMVGERITSGFPNGEFRPGNEVTRQAMAAFLYHYDQQAAPDPDPEPEPDPEPDPEPGDGAADADGDPTIVVTFIAGSGVVLSDTRAVLWVRDPDGEGGALRGSVEADAEGVAQFTPPIFDDERQTLADVQWFATIRDQICTGTTDNFAWPIDGRIGLDVLVDPGEADECSDADQ